MSFRLWACSSTSFGHPSLSVGLRLRHRLPSNLHSIPALLPTCMSVLAILITAIKSAITALRTTASALEVAVEQAEAISGQVITGSTVSEWDYIPSEGSAAGYSAALSRGYDAVAETITQAPPAALAFASRLPVSPTEKRERIQRAWEAGLWARAVLEGRISKPRPTPKTALRSTVYVIVRAPGLARPCWVSSAAEYYRILPQFTEDSLSHSFASQAEARAYCLAIGIDFPDGPSEQQ